MIYRARCIRDCYWRGEYWREGEIYRGPEMPPEWFELLDEDDDPEDEELEELAEDILTKTETGKSIITDKDMLDEDETAADLERILLS